MARTATGALAPRSRSATLSSVLELGGIEDASIEIEGTIPVEAARRILGAGELEPEIVSPGRARVGVLFFRMRRLGPLVFAGRIGTSYREALFRVGTALAGAPAWACPACDLDRAHVRALGAWLVRYPTFAARIAIEDGECSWRACSEAAGEGLEVVASVGAEVPPPTPRRVVVMGATGVFEVPWREEPGPWRRAAKLTVPREARARTAFSLRRGEVLAWESSATLLRGRLHICGIARPLRAG